MGRRRRRGDIPSFLWLLQGRLTALTLVAALAGAVIITLQTDEGLDIGPVEFVTGYGAGELHLEPVDVVGEHAFTNPVAADLGLDPLLLASSPINAATFGSPHRHDSQADRLATVIGRALVERRDRGDDVSPRSIRDVTLDVLGPEVVLEDLADGDRDGLDDDARFTLVAPDGSAVCVDFGPPRFLLRAQSLTVDTTGATANGLHIDPHGPCGSVVSLQASTDLRIGSNPGVFGGSPLGEVCDIDSLVALLLATPVVGEAWAAVHEIEVDQIPGFAATLTPVVLLRDTAVSEFGFRSGTIVPRLAVLQRGTTVLVDERGGLRARCISGNPLRTAPPIPDEPTVFGHPWTGFSPGAVDLISAGSGTVGQFVLVDVTTGLPIVREAGINGSSSSLAGPIYPVPVR